ncbi:MAG TPA: hypothetical protein VH371_08940 [Candidatus Limnocylindrales bacterium]|jgi:hypothetical protein
MTGKAPSGTTTEEEGTTFANVDLEVISRSPLDPLVQAFGRKVDVLYVGPWGRRYGAFVEAAGSGYRGTANSLIRRLVALVKALPRNARRLWDTAQSRDFDIGIEAGAKSRTFELRLEPDTLKAVTDVGGRIVITVYAPERIHEAPTPEPKLGDGRR